MSRREARGDYRTWLLLVLALVPAASVLAGASWLWSTRGQELDDFDASLVPVQTSFELFRITSRLLQAEAGLTAAALPEAADDLLVRAETDRQRALTAVEGAEGTLLPLLDRIDPGSDVSDQKDVVELIGGSVGMASTMLEQQTAGEPVAIQLQFLVELARDNASGLVLPFVQSGDLDAGYFYDALAATVRYHDQYDRDRAEILRALESGDDAEIAAVFAAAQRSELRAAEWDDLVDSRNFVPQVSAAGWSATTADPDAPLLLDRTEPISRLISTSGVPVDRAGRDAFVRALIHIDDVLQTDVAVAHHEFDGAAARHRESVVFERRLMAGASALMTVLGFALFRLTISEIRRRRRVEDAHDGAIELLADKADRDPTTGAWNRRRLESAVRVALTDAADLGETVVLAYIDLDRFKAINDVWGHHTGDQVLATVTARLQSFEFDDVRFELSRFGGDEFVLHTQTAVKTLDWLELLGRRIIENVGTRMAIDDRQHAVGASVGIATSNQGSTFDSLLLEADSSLILAKREQRGTAIVYNRDISRTGELVHALPAAFAGNEVAAHLQPIIDVRTGRVIDVEALARWTRAGGEIVSPVVFVPLVESFGLAEELTTTVLRCIARVVADPATPTDVRVWINVSPYELDVANFAERFVTIVRGIGLSPRRIGIEITETAAVRDPVRLGAEIRQLREVGIGVAIDDFGSGYSPLGYLRVLPVDSVKLDRSLISNIDTDSANQHIVRGIVGLVHELGMSITAEGVERAEEEDWLIAQGVNRVQGYLHGRPVPPDQMRWVGTPAEPVRQPIAVIGGSTGARS